MCIPRFPSVRSASKEIPMPEYLRARVITRDVRNFPHRDLENSELRTDIEMWWGEKPVPKGYVTVFELGEQKLDFEGGLDLSPHTPSNYETSVEAAEAVDDYGTPRPARVILSRLRSSTIPCWELVPRSKSWEGK